MPNQKYETRSESENDGHLIKQPVKRKEFAESEWIARKLRKQIEPELRN
jgi:hypothetical protein